MSCHVTRGCVVSAPHVRVRQSNQLYVRLAMFRKCLFVLTCLRVGGAIGSRPVLFDCDPGVDDSLALAWLCARPDAARLVAVTTIPGNVPAHQTLSNAARLLDFFNCGAAQLGAGFDGAGKSVGFMGDDGLFGLSSQLRQEDLSTARNATEVIVDMVDKYGSELVIISAGPATNLAAAERRKPGVLAKAGEILLMGGGIRTFNAPPAPEVSIKVLIHKSHVVLVCIDWCCVVISQPSLLAHAFIFLFLPEPVFHVFYRRFSSSTAKMYRSPYFFHLHVSPCLVQSTQSIHEFLHPQRKAPKRSTFIQTQLTAF